MAFIKKKTEKEAPEKQEVRKGARFKKVNTALSKTESDLNPANIPDNKGNPPKKPAIDKRAISNQTNNKLILQVEGSEDIIELEKGESVDVESGKEVYAKIPSEEESKDKKEEKKELELIEQLEFKNGENTLTIRFSKKHNRMFRVQTFLNGVSEIRPVTYTGSSTAYGYWNLLKGALKK